MSNNRGDDAQGLSDEIMRRLYPWLLWVVVSITLLKGFRLPNLYSATHFVLNYSQGFVRRGLVGTVSQALLGDIAFKYQTFVALAFCLMGLALVALMLSISRAIHLAPGDFLLRCALLTFLSSPGLVFFVHMVGYLDYIGLIAVVAVVLWSSQSNSRFLPFAVVGTCGLVFALIHEILAVMFMPVFSFVMTCHALRLWPHQSPLGRAGVFTGIVVVVGTAFVLSGLVSTVGTRDVQTIGGLHAHLSAKVDFTLRPDAFSALARSSAENVTTLMPWYWSANPDALLAPKSWLAILPSLLFLARYGTILLRQLPGPSWLRWGLIVNLLACIISPQVLNLVGWDWNRWNAISLLAGFVAILATKLYFPLVQVPARFLSSLVTAAVVTLALNLAATTPLFDRFTVQFFPFDNQVDFLIRTLQPGPSYRPVF